MTIQTDGIHTKVSAMVVNYQTPDLLETAVRSFKEQYSAVSLTIIDNGSRDASRRVIDHLVQELPQMEEMILTENLFHGPAMDLGLRRSPRPFTYVFDSDTETRRGGFLEDMVERLSDDPHLYGAGQVVHVDRRGFARASGTAVLSSAHMLLKTAVYLQLPPFVHHGLPALANFRAANEQGFQLISWPIGDYVHHLGRGTADRYGYGLGLRAKLDYVLAKLGL